ncbi:MAG: NAD(P)-dependent glycerol-3-phosphate dehydrogenase [Opitutales bacterium]|nr:NAD(P)-dependent glycerol-3-phosphate dehydrogenase [Opitutales bacterium]
MNFCILPAGAWGTAMAIHLNRLGHTVTLIPRTAEEALEMSTERENKAFFPGHKLDPSLQIGMEYKPALMEADVLILACPSRFLKSVCNELKESLDPSNATRLNLIVALCKGLDPTTRRLPITLIEEELPGFPCGILSGPTFASQVATSQPTAMVFASRSKDKALKDFQEASSGSNLRIYTSSDVEGVSLGGCLKNVYAIASGICDGLGFTDNTKAALLTRSLAEMVRIGKTLGGEMETFFGLSGFGDLVLTCNGQESRNRTFGELFAKGESIQSLIEDKGMTVEGYWTCKSFHDICLKKGIEAPILDQIYRVLYEDQNIPDALVALMGRDLKQEAF